MASPPIRLVLAAIFETIFIYFALLQRHLWGPGNIVGIATGIGLDGPVIESRWRVRFSAPVQTGPGAHPASCRMGTGSFPGGKGRPRREADPSPLLVPWSWRDRAIPLLPLWAVRPVQSLSACTRVHFILIYFTLRHFVGRYCVSRSQLQIILSFPAK